MNVLRNKNTAIVVKMPILHRHLSHVRLPVIGSDGESLWTGSAEVGPVYHLFSLREYGGENVVFSIRVDYFSKHAWRDL